MTRQMADDEVLRPCPFCGEAAEFVPYKRDGLTLKCKSFGCAKFSQRAMRHSLEWLREKMAESWNNRPAVAALQAERDALRKKVGELDAQLGAAPCRGANADGKPRCMNLADTESALEALRGQVAGIAEMFAETASHSRHKQAAEVWAYIGKTLSELLAIKERMG